MAPSLQLLATRLWHAAHTGAYAGGSILFWWASEVSKTEESKSHLEHLIVTSAPAAEPLCWVGCLITTCVLIIWPKVSWSTPFVNGLSLAVGNVFSAVSTIWPSWPRLPLPNIHRFYVEPACGILLRRFAACHTIRPALPNPGYYEPLAPDVVGWQSLPDDVVANIFSMLTVDARLMCREVAPAWRALLEAHEHAHVIWAVCDLSSATIDARRSPNLLRAASNSACGQIRVLDVSSWTSLPGGVLLDTLKANASSVKILKWWPKVGGLNAAGIKSVLDAAPQLEEFHTDAYCSSLQDALAILANDAPFGPLRARTTTVDSAQPWSGTALAAAAASQGPPSHLSLLSNSIRDHRVLEAVAQLATTKLNAVSVTLNARQHGPHLLPALAGIISAGGMLQAFSLVQKGPCQPLFLSPDISLAMFSAALRASKLTSIALSFSDGVFVPSTFGLASVLDACIGHETLKCVSINGDTAVFDPMLCVGSRLAALAALVTADSALECLDVRACGIGDEGMRALFGALAGNTRLRKLSCGKNGMSASCARDILPAARAFAFGGGGIRRELDLAPEFERLLHVVF